MGAGQLHYYGGFSILGIERVILITMMILSLMIGYKMMNHYMIFSGLFELQSVDCNGKTQNIR